MKRSKNHGDNVQDSNLQTGIRVTSQVEVLRSSAETLLRKIVDERRHKLYSLTFMFQSPQRLTLFCSNHEKKPKTKSSVKICQ